MTSIEQDIVDWAATRPPWQQNLIARISRGEDIGQSDIDDLALGIVNESIDLTTTPLVLEDIQYSSSTGSSVDLISVGNLSNVNALLPAQTLSFGPSGLTVVYGDNGSGKSGYARLIKELVAARHTETVLPDAYAPDSARVQHADVSYAVDGRVSSRSWPGIEDSNLRKIHFYDEACGNDYLESESELSYRPSVLSIFDRLIEATDLIRAAVDGLISAKQQSKSQLPVLTSGSKAHSFLTGLSKLTTTPQIDEFVHLDPGASERLATLLQEEARLKGTDPSKEKLRLKVASGQLNSLASHFDLIDDIFSVRAVEKLVELQTAAADLRQAANLASAADFAAEPLGGVGTEAWRALWMAAQKYSEDEAFVGRDFPASDAGDHCVLCQQPLMPDGRSRMSRFHQFVHNETANNAKQAEAKYVAGVSAVEDLIVSTTETTAALTFLTVEDSHLATQLKKALETAQESKDRTLARVKAETDEPPVALDEVDADGIRDLVDSIAERSNKIDDEEFQRRLADTTSRRIELSDLILLSNSQSLLIEEVARLKDLGILQRARSQLGTGPMTIKSSALARTYVTAAVSDRFVRESDRLMLDHVVLGDRGGDKGKLRHKPALLDSPSDHLPSDVLSEGEQTALGLAGLFTEIHFDDSKSAVVLDDPVSSLDHNRRKKTAQRIVDIAVDRQVIVFTHDLTFLGELVSSADAKGVPLAERSIERNGAKTPGHVLQAYPWKAKDARKRLSDLTTELARIKKAQVDLTTEEYEKQTCDWAGRLSETWERLVRSEVVNKVVDRGTTEVRPMMFRLLARITADDDRDFQTGYGEVSEWARRHDKSEEVNYSAPTIEEMQAELDRAIAWHKRMVIYAQP